MKLRVQGFGDMRFRHPVDWQAELIADMNGMLVMDPAIENEWQANLFFEFAEDEEDLDRAGAAAVLGGRLAESKMGFQLIDLRRENHPTGPDSIIVEYQSMQDGIELHQWDIMMYLGGRNRLYITAASERNLWGKYQPVFESIIDSIRFAS